MMLRDFVQNLPVQCSFAACISDQLLFVVVAIFGPYCLLLFFP